MRRVFFLLVVSAGVSFVALIASAYFERTQFSARTPVRMAPPTTITMGAILPLSGEAAVVGEPIRQAAVLAIEELNAAGGVRGLPIELAVFDGKCDARTAATVAARLIAEHHPSVILGGGCSSETLAAAPVTERAEVVLFSPASTSPALTGAGVYVFRNAPSDVSQGRLLAEAAATRFDRVGIMQEETDYAVGIGQVFTASFAAAGGELVVVSATSDADTVAGVDELAAVDVDAILLLVQTPDKAAAVFAELTRRGWTPPLLVNDVVLGAPEVLGAYPAVTEGLIAAELDVDETSEQFIAFASAFEERWEVPVTYSFYASLSYDAVYLLAEALAAAGTRPAELREYLMQVTRRPGAAGLLTLNENGDPDSGHVLKQWREGTLVPLEAFGEPPATLSGDDA